MKRLLISIALAAVLTALVAPSFALAAPPLGTGINSITVNVGEGMPLFDTRSTDGVPPPEIMIYGQNGAISPGQP